MTFDETVDIQRIHGTIDWKLRPDKDYGERLFLTMGFFLHDGKLNAS